MGKKNTKYLIIVNEVNFFQRSLKINLKYNYYNKNKELLNIERKLFIYYNFL